MKAKQAMAATSTAHAELAHGTSMLWTTRDLRWALVAAASLLLIAGISYGLFLNRIGLYLDDWRNLGDFILHGQLVQRTARPVNLAVLTAGWELFGLNISAYLVVAVLLSALAAWMAWLLLYVLLPQGYRALALPIAMLFLVYPSNYSRVWLTLWPTGLLVAIVFGGVLAYVLFLRGRSPLWCLIALLLLGASLLWYELQAGLIAALPILGITQLRRASWWRRFLIVSPTLLVLTFVLWWILAPSSSKEYGPSGLVLTVAEIVRRFVRSPWTLLVVSWVEPLRFVGPASLPRWLAIGTFGIIAVVVGGLALLAVRWLPLKDVHQPAPSSTRYDQRVWLVGAFLGLLCLIMGALPALPRSEMVVALFDSRFSLFAALGAAALIVFLAFGFAGWIYHKRQTSVYYVYFFSVPFVLLAMLYQLRAQQALIVGWDRQKCAWSSMLAQAPSFADGTYVHILDVPPPANLMDIAPFGLLVSEVATPLKLLYNNPTLNGSYQHIANSVAIDGLRFRLTPEGIKSDDTGTLIPYQDAVIFRYLPDDSLELLKIIPPELSGANAPQPTGVDRILQTPVESPYRQLVDVEPNCQTGSSVASAVNLARRTVHD